MPIMAESRGILRLEIDNARSAQGAACPPVLVWASEGEPPSIAGGIIAAVNGSSVSWRAGGGAGPAELSALGEWKSVQGVRVRVVLTTRELERPTFDLATHRAAPQAGAHVQVRTPGRAMEAYALPTMPGTAVKIGARAAGADLTLDSAAVAGGACRITFDGREYRVDSPDANALAQVNGQDVFWPVPLREGDRIVVGRAELVFSTRPTDVELRPIIVQSAPGTRSKSAAPAALKDRPDEGIVGRATRGRGFGMLGIAVVFVAGLLALMGWRLWGR